MARFTRFLAALLLAVLLVPGVGAETSPAAEAEPLSDEAALRVLREVQSQVAALRGLPAGEPIPVYTLDGADVERLVRRDFNEQASAAERTALQAALTSLGALPEGFDLLQTMLDMLGEQVGGLYDENTKRLYVRKDFDVVQSDVARMILAHEICHALQDRAYGLAGFATDVKNSDRRMAALAVVEGDATLLMQEYLAMHATMGMLEEMPQMLTMDQSAFNAAPRILRQELLFPYLRGEALLREAMRRDPALREELFRNPPVSTEQVMHPAEKLLDERDAPTSPTFPSGFEAPDAMRRILADSFGEFGVKALFEERLGTGLALTSAAGWDGDLFEAWAPEAAAADGPWHFRWATVWDAPEDAAQFQRAFVALWRALAGERVLGDYGAEDQRFRAGDWDVRILREGANLTAAWSRD